MSQEEIRKFLREQPAPFLGEKKTRGDDHKLDHGKLMWDLLPLDQVEKIVNILTFGAEKYEKDGWKQVPDAENRYFAALMRHLSRHQAGEKFDPESQRPHLWHAACNILFLLWFEDTIKFNTQIRPAMEELVKQYIPPTVYGTIRIGEGQ